MDEHGVLSPQHGRGDGVTVKTFLRPDYYEFFPLFTIEQLRQRFRWLPIHLATLLGRRNLVLAADDPILRSAIRQHFASPFETQRLAAAEVLEHVGVSPSVVAAISRVPREDFLLPEYRDFSYVNSYVPFSAGSGLTGFGLVALMLQSLQLASPARVVEVGVGSGYHAACLAALDPGNIEYIGFEVNEEFARRGEALVARAPFKRSSVIAGSALAAESHRFGDLDCVYATAAGPSLRDSALADLVTPGGTLQEVRALSQPEFESEPATSWLRVTYGSFSDYLAGDWRTFSCIATAERTDAGWEDRDLLYDVMFVPLVAERTAASAVPPEDPYLRLRDLR